MVRIALLLCACASVVAASAQASPAYFVVAEPPESVYHFDSYILPLYEPADIAQARQLIQSGQRQIVFAAIAPGADGINRDVYHNKLWSWHVTEFEGFADMGIELLDGWPTYVESDVAGWMANTGGHIGFWSYTVVAELSAVPEPSTLLMAGIGGVATVLAIGRRRLAAHCAGSGGASRRFC